MKRLPILILAVIMLVACNRSQSPPTVVIQLPTPTPIPTLTPSPIPPAVTPAEGIGGGGEGAVVALVNYTFEPAKIMVVDAATGAEQTLLDAPGLSAFSLVYAGGPFVFYSEQFNQSVKRVDFEGNVIELPFISATGPDFYFLPAPDGNRVAWGTTAFDPNGGDGSHITFNVANVDGSEAKVLVDETIQNASILPQPIQWSADGRYVYYTDLPYGIGGYILFGGGPNLKRVEVATGEIAEIVPNTGCLCAMRVSPDGETVAVITGAGPLELVLRHIETGAERKVEIDGGHLQAGNVLWSPDGATLIYTMAVSNFDNPDAEKFAIVKVAAATLAQTILVADNESLYNALAWPISEGVWANDKNGAGWRIDVSTGALKQAEDGFGVVR
jgi:hypothetical protein